MSRLKTNASVSTAVSGLGFLGGAVALADGMSLAGKLAGEGILFLLVALVLFFWSEES